VRTPSTRTVDPWLVGPVAALLILSALPGGVPGIPPTRPDLPPLVGLPTHRTATPVLVPSATESRLPTTPPRAGNPTLGSALDAAPPESHPSRTIGSRPSTGALVATIVSAPSRVDVGVTVRLAGTASGGAEPYDPFWSLETGNVTSGWSLDWTAPDAVRSVEVLFEVRDHAGAYAYATTTIDVVGAPFLEVASASGLGDVGVPFVFSANLTAGSGPFTVDWSVVDGRSNGTTVVPSDGTYELAVVPSSPGPVWVLASVVDVWNRSFDGLTPVGRATPGPSLSGPSVPFAEVGYPTPLSVEVAGGTPPFAWEAQPTGGVSAESPSDGMLPNDGPIGLSVTFAEVGPVAFPLSLVDGSGVRVTANVTVDVAAGLNLTVALGTTDPSVDAGVAVRAAIAGGLAPYAYRLSLSDGESSAGNTSASGVVPWTIEPVASGYVTLRGSVTDATGRSANVTFTFYVASSGAAPAPPLAGNPSASGWLLAGALGGALFALVGGYSIRRWGRRLRRTPKPSAPEGPGRTTVRELLEDAEDGVDRATLELLAEERRMTSEQLGSALDYWRRAGRVRIGDDGDGRELVRWVAAPPTPEPTSVPTSTDESAGAP